MTVLTPSLLGIDLAGDGERRRRKGPGDGLEAGLGELERETMPRSTDPGATSASESVRVTC